MNEKITRVLAYTFVIVFFFSVVLNVVFWLTINKNNDSFVELEQTHKELRDTIEDGEERSANVINIIEASAGLVHEITNAVDGSRNGIEATIAAIDGSLDIIPILAECISAIEEEIRKGYGN